MGVYQLNYYKKMGYTFQQRRNEAKKPKVKINSFKVILEDSPKKLEET